MSGEGEGEKEKAAEEGDMGERQRCMEGEGAGWRVCAVEEWGRGGEGEESAFRLGGRGEGQRSGDESRGLRGQAGVRLGSEGGGSRAGGKSGTGSGSRGGKGGGRDDGRDECSARRRRGRRARRVGWGRREWGTTVWTRPWTRRRGGRRSRRRRTGTGTATDSGRGRRRDEEGC